MNTTHEQDVLESELLSDAAAGDQSPFERLYSLYEKRVYQYVYSFVHDPALAEEIVGESMMAVWRGAGTFARTSRVSTWIFGIARHKALDALRRTGKQQREIEPDGAAEMPDHRDSPADCLQRKQAEGVTKQALSKLSPEHQEILRLVFYEELPYDDIASLLSIPTNTVKTRVYYAKQRLKEQLERMGQKESIQ